MEIFIVRDGQRYGPYSVDQVRGYLQSGELVPTDQAWREGMNEMEPLETFLVHVARPVQHPTGLIGSQKVAVKPNASDKKSTMPIALPEGLSKMRTKYAK